MIIARGRWRQYASSSIASAIEGAAPRTIPVARIASPGARSFSRSPPVTQLVVDGSRKPRLRFAPSPTGHLHLGGLRTALFNHLFAKKFGGKWLLRIEDTDQTRLVPGAVESLQESLRWCGLEYDEGPDVGGSSGPYIQSERRDLYLRYAASLLESGKAYRDFRPASEAPEQSYANKKGMALRRWVDRYVPPKEDEARALIRDGKTFVVRLKTKPRNVVCEDLVYGTMSFPADAAAADPILLKSDGWPTYHLANVVDDHEMGITHVLRGEEWLPSLPKHLAIYAALGLSPPTFAHLPLLMNADGTKLSKRSGDVHVNAYRQEGWEPEALVNFIALMGYNHHNVAKSDGPSQTTGPDDREVMSMAQLIDGFEPQRISHSRATLDLAKLEFLNRKHLSLKSPSTLVPKLRTILRERSLSPAILNDEAALTDVMSLVSERAHRLVDVASEAAFLFWEDAALPEWTHSPVALEMEAAFGPGVYREVLAHVMPKLRQVSDWRSSDTQVLLKKLLTQVAKDAAVSLADRDGSGVAAGKVRPLPVPKVLRHALTAKPSGPAIVDILAVLGKDRSLQRLEAALRRVEAKS
ncbi:unnamed protein product [Parajaminaea phylloscopi]